MRPGNQEILTYLNKIRERAACASTPPGATDNNYIHVNLADQDAMRKLIHAERRVGSVPRARATTTCAAGRRPRPHCRATSTA